jgi:hypothetical protein
MHVSTEIHLVVIDAINKTGAGFESVSLLASTPICSADSAEMSVACCAGAGSNRG